MDRTLRRFLSILLCICMTLGMTSGAAAYAQGEGDQMAVLGETDPNQTAASTDETASSEAAGLTEETDATASTEETLTGAESGETTAPEEGVPTEETKPSETTDPTEETSPSKVTDPTAETNPSAATDPTGETNPSEATDPSGETDPSEETAPTEESTDPTDSAPVTYPWDDMTDEDFLNFMMAEGYSPYAEDADALASLSARVERVADEQVRLFLAAVLEAFVNHENFHPTDLLASTYAASSGMITLAELNSPDMFFRQSSGGKCTLAASAMLVRRAARLNGYPYWSSIDENSLRGVAWIEGTGMTWNYTHAGITVTHGYFSSGTVEQFLAFLRQHPEGFVAYIQNVHAVLITDYDERTGTIYCADPASGGRIPLVQAHGSTGNQTTTVKRFTAYWCVSSPKLSLNVPSVPAEERTVVVSASSNADHTVSLNWTNTGAAGYRVYRSNHPDGPWDAPIYNAAGANNVTWTDTTTAMLQTYYYCVEAYNGAGEAICRSEVVSCTPDRGVAHAAEGVCANGIRWVFYMDYVLLVTGNGPMEDYASVAEQPWLKCRSVAQTVIISDGITQVGSHAFEGFVDLRSVSLASSVISVGDGAFHNCFALSSVEMPGVRSIGNAVFQDCTGLTGIELPQGLAVIGDNAFRGTSLKNVSFPGSLTSIGAYAFAMCGGIGDLDLTASTALTLGEGAFYGCTGITSLTLPTVYAETKAFADCGNLTSVTIDQKVGGGSLADNVFQGCGKLGMVLILGARLTASDSAFAGTPARIMVSSSFYGDDFTAVIGGNHWSSFARMGSFGDGLLWYVDGRNNMFICGTGSMPDYMPNRTPWINLAPSIVTVTVEEGISYIGYYAFYQFSNLKKVTILGSAPTIGYSAFHGVTTDVYYHDLDGSWKNVAGQPYNGRLTWKQEHSCTWAVDKVPTATADGALVGSCSICGAKETVTLPKLNETDYIVSGGVYTWKVTDYGTIVINGSSQTAQLYGNSLTLDGDIGLNFYVILPDSLAADSGAYALVNGSKRMVSSATVSEVSGKTLYKFSCKVASPAMGVRISFRLYDGNGQIVKLMKGSQDITDTYSYSIADYCAAASQTNNSKLKPLVEAMANYGHYSQLHFGTGVPVAAPAGFSMAAANLTALSAYAPQVTGSVPGMTYLGSSVVLESETTIKHYFTLDAGSRASDYAVTVDGVTAQLEVSGNTCVVRIPNVTAPRLGVAHRIVVAKGSSSIVIDNYSAFSYAYMAVNSNSSEALKNTVRALYCYGIAAKNYFGV